MSNSVLMRTKRATLALLATVTALAAVPASVAAPGTGPIATNRPSVAGTSAVGRRLTAQTGTWTGSGAMKYGFQWYRCDANGARCNAVHGATSATYTLVGRDVAKTIGLTVWVY